MHFSHLILLFTGIFLVIFSKMLANHQPLRIWVLDKTLSPQVSRYFIILFGVLLVVIALLTSRVFRG
jgi:hypothetical protein